MKMGSLKSSNLYPQTRHIIAACFALLALTVYPKLVEADQFVRIPESQLTTIRINGVTDIELYGRFMDDQPRSSDPISYSYTARLGQFFDKFCARRLIPCAGDFRIPPGEKLLLF